MFSKAPHPARGSARAVQRGRTVGRVEAPADADLEHDDVDPLLYEDRQACLMVLVIVDS